MMKTRLITLLIAITTIIGSAYAQKKIEVYKNGEVVYSEYITDIDSIKFKEQTAPLPNTENGHEYVDLGLPSGIKWATCNVGANSPEEYGDYFAWGETKTDDYYEWGSYKYCCGVVNTFTKYCMESYYELAADFKTVLDIEDDVAYVNWGGNWRMPTRAEQDELRDTNNCIWEWTTQNGVNGYKVTSKKNGNYIFLPAAGYRYRDFPVEFGGAGGYGYYWSSSLYTSTSSSAYSMEFNLSEVNWNDSNRDCGLSVRPVCESSISTPKPIICTVSVSATEGGTVSVSATEVEKGAIVTLNATHNDGYYFTNWTLNGEIVFTKPIFTTQITVDAEFKANFKKIRGIENNQEWIDLGLPSGIKWATCNVGANSPEEYGDYFAWGETQPKSTYNWSTYKYCNGTYDSLTKYCTNLGVLDVPYGTIDNKVTLELEDDAAYVNWGGNWRMPTIKELDELKNTSNCTWTWSTQNGVNGYKVTSKKNGNSIFLPAASKNNDYGYYWSNSLESGYSSYVGNCMILDEYHEYDGLRYSNRCSGLSIRAVCE